MAAKRLFGPAALGNATATKYTVPAGLATVIRHIHVSNPSAAAVDLTLGIGADAAGTRLFDGYPIPADSPYDWYGYLPMVAGEIMPAHASVAATLVIEISGEETVAG